MSTGPKGGADSSRIGGCVRYGCDIRSARRRAEALAGCTRIIGEGVWGVNDGDKLNASFSHDRRGSIMEGFRGDGVRRGGKGVGQVVRWLGRSLTTRHMDPERVQAFFGDRHQFPGIYDLRHIARVGVSVDVRPGVDVTKELTHGNHSSAQKLHVAVWETPLQTLRGAVLLFVFPKGTGGEGRRIAGITGRGSGRAEKDKNHPLHDF